MLSKLLYLKITIIIVIKYSLSQMEREGGAWAGNGAKCPMDGRSALMRGPCPMSCSLPAPRKALLWPRGARTEQGWHGRALQDLTPRAEPALLFQEQPEHQCGSTSSPALRLASKALQRPRHQLLACPPCLVQQNHPGMAVGVQTSAHGSS